MWFVLWNLHGSYRHVLQIKIATMTRYSLLLLRASLLCQLTPIYPFNMQVGAELFKVKRDGAPRYERLRSADLNFYVKLFKKRHKRQL